MFLDDDKSVSRFDDALVAGLGELVARAADVPSTVVPDRVVILEREAKRHDAPRVAAFADERNQTDIRSEPLDRGLDLFVDLAYPGLVLGHSPRRQRTVSSDWSATRIRLLRDLLRYSLALVDNNELRVLLDDGLDLG